MRRRAPLLVRRTLHTDLAPAALWREVLALEWLGHDVNVDLHRGGSGSLVDDDGTLRRMVVDEIGDATLRFHWWPERTGIRSDVCLTVVADGDGARLEVTEVTVAPRLDASAKARRWEARLQALAERCASLIGV